MQPLQVTLLFIGQIALNVLSNVGFKLSASASEWRGFLFWQVLGNLAGLGTVLGVTALYHRLPMHVVFPVTQGLAVLGVQVFAAKLLFKETIGPTQWAGSLLVAAGIALLSVRQG